MAVASALYYVYPYTVVSRSPFGVETKSSFKDVPYVLSALEVTGGSQAHLYLHFRRTLGP